MTACLYDERDRQPALGDVDIPSATGETGGRMSNRTSIPRYLAIDSAQSSQAFGADEERTRELARTIEAEIVPSLLMSVAPSRAADEALAGSNFGAEPDYLDELTRLLLVHEGAVASAFEQILHERGTPADRICLEVLAPAARRLGTLWEQDACDFAQLTLGLTRLNALLLEVSGQH